MPWKASSVMEERLRFVARLLDGEAMTEVCREFGKPTQGLPRRAFLAAIAVLPAALPAAASTLPAEPDPIYAAIEACREARHVADAAYARVRHLYKLAEKRVGNDLEAKNAFIEEMIGEHPDAYTDNPSMALWDSYEVLSNTEPTTLAGLFAMLIYAGEVADCEPDVLNEFGIFATFATAARALLGRSA